MESVTTLHERNNILGLQKELAIYISENHPDMILAQGKKAIEEFCVNRADEAIEICANNCERGIHRDVAIEMAREHLYEGLLFSKANTMENVLNEIDPAILQDIKDYTVKVALITKLISACKEIFDNHSEPKIYHAEPKLMEALVKKTTAILTEKN